MDVPTPPAEQIDRTLAELKAKLLMTRGLPRAATDLDYRSEYLKSTRWTEIKRRVLERDGKKCFSCGGQGTLVHHRSYEPEVLEGYADHLLATVCSGCHELIHFSDEGTRRSAEECEALLVKGFHAAEVPEPKIDGRGRKTPYPLGWSRMTAKQRHIWSNLYGIRLCERRVAIGHVQWETKLQELRAERDKLV